MDITITHVGVGSSLLAAVTALVKLVRMQTSMELGIKSLKAEMEKALPRTEDKNRRLSDALDALRAELRADIEKSESRVMKLLEANAASDAIERQRINALFESLRK